jgi:hypothetical protein
MTDTAEIQQPPVSTQPISPPTKPMQYRAIGLLKARYVPSAEEIAKGILLTTDGTIIDAVVKGKLLSLVKNKLDLEKEHLWVVYPKTPKRKSQIPLHVQLAGIWEPETLHPELETTNELHYQADDFSVQGEVGYQDYHNGVVVVKIKQKLPLESEKAKFFKIQLQGFLPPKSLKNFWEFKVQRVGTNLVIQSAECIASVQDNDKGKGKKTFHKNKKYRPRNDSQKKPFPKKQQSQTT